MIKLLPYILFDKLIDILSSESASPGNRHCASCIGTLSAPHCVGVSSSAGSGVATGWTGVDMSTPRLLEVAPEIDTDLTSVYREEGYGGSVKSAPPPDPSYRHALRARHVCTSPAHTLCPKKVSPLNILQQPPQTCTDLNKFYTHKTTSIFVIDVKFHTNPLFRLRDVQFFQTAVTNLSYRYNFLLADVICGDRCDVSAC